MLRQSITYTICYIHRKIMNGTEHKDHNDGYIETSTMCPNRYLYVDLPNLNCVCWCCQNSPTLSLTDKETIPPPFISYTKYDAYKKKIRFSIHGLSPLSEQKKCA